MNRRRFLALTGLGVSGIWIDGAGLFPLQKHVVIALTGKCCFCGKSAGEVFSMVGVMGQPARICDECINNCLQARQNSTFLSHFTEPPERIEKTCAYDFKITRLPDLRTLETATDLDEFVNQWRQLMAQGIEGDWVKRGELSCSFCDRKQYEVRGNLIAGIESYICDFCISEAGALVSKHRY